MSLKLYGLKNCDTCRKALKALSAAGVEHEFMDVRADGVSAAQVAAWAGAVGWQKLLNTKSTTWRGLSEAEKTDVDEAKAARLMAEHSTLIPSREQTSTPVAAHTPCPLTHSSPRPRKGSSTIPLLSLST